MLSQKKTIEKDSASGLMMVTNICEREKARENVSNNNKKMKLKGDFSKIQPDFSDRGSSTTHVPSGVGIRDRAGDTWRGCDAGLGSEDGAGVSSMTVMGWFTRPVKAYGRVRTCS